MNYTVQTTKYIFKNFFYVLPFAVVPALFLALSISNDAVQSVLTNLLNGNPHDSFWNYFQAISLFNFSSWETVLSGTVGVAAVIFSVSMLMAFLEKHLRIGKKTFNGLLSKVNDNLISTFGVAILCLVLYEVWSVILAALCFLVTWLSETLVAYILLGIVYLAMHFVLLYFLSLFYLWLPCMQITGFRAFEALRYSYQLVAPIRVGLIWGQWAFLLICEGLLALSVILVESAAMSFAVGTVLFTVILLIYCVRMQIVYFDRAQIERADLKKYNF